MSESNGANYNIIKDRQISIVKVYSNQNDDIS
jgi:hypothetical protein